MASALLPVGNYSTQPPAGEAKAFREGTHRRTEPGETLCRITPLLGALGITRVANVTGLDHIGVPVIMVCRPNSRSVAVSQGKGLTLAAAKVSGIMESLELWHAENIDAPLRLATYREMQPSCRTIDIARLPVALRSRFRPDLAILWIQGRDLMSSGEAWVPLECVSMNSTLPLPTGSGCFLSTSNGLASGNTVLEATSHAICEVIERDATALWRAAQGSVRAERLVDLASVDDPSCREVLDRCESSDVQVLAWDITSDITVSAFAAIVTERHAIRQTRSTAIGYGCHTNAGVALLRAITEAIQSRLTYISGSRDDLFRREYEDNLRTRQAIDRFHELAAEPAQRRFTDIPSVNADTFEEDLAHELAHLQDVGVREVICVELTKPEFGVPVVRVVIPGLEGPDSDPDYVAGPRALAVMESHL